MKNFYICESKLLKAAFIFIKHTLTDNLWYNIGRLKK